MDPTAVDLLQFVPAAPNGGTLIRPSPPRPYAGPVHGQVDHRLNDKQNLSIYYYFNDEPRTRPSPTFELAGAQCPGIRNIVAERFQQWNITHTWTISNSTVNEFHLNYNREGQQTFQHPANTELVQNSCPLAPIMADRRYRCAPLFLRGRLFESVTSTASIPILARAARAFPYLCFAEVSILATIRKGSFLKRATLSSLQTTLTRISGPIHQVWRGRPPSAVQSALLLQRERDFNFYGGGQDDPAAFNKTAAKISIPTISSVFPTHSARFSPGRVCAQHRPLSIRTG